MLQIHTILKDSGMTESSPTGRALEAMLQDYRKVPVAFAEQISDRLDFLFLAFLRVYHWLSKLLV